MRRLLLAAVLALTLAPAVAAIAEGTPPMFLEPVVDGQRKAVSTFWEYEGQWMAEASTWESLGVILEPGEEGRALSAAELGIGFDVHLEDMTVAMSIPADRLPMQTQRTANDQAPLAPMAPGVLVNYSLAGSVAEDHQAVSIGHELRFRALGGVITTSGQANWSSTSGAAYTRGLSRWQRDDVQRQVVYQVGDVMATGSGRPVNLGGVRVAKDPRALDPNTPTWPVPVLGGVALDPGQVRVLANEAEVLRQDVERGPFTIDHYGLNPGRNSTSVVVRDQFGRETVLQQQDLYFTRDLLRDGLATWEVAAGRVRNGRDDYGDVGAAAAVAWGASDRWTLHASAQVDSNSHSNATVGATTVLGAVGGVLDVEAGRSTGPEGPGSRVAASYDWRTRTAGVRVEHERQDNWWQLEPASGVALERATRLNAHWRPTRDLMFQAGYTHITTSKHRLRYAQLGARYAHGPHSLAANVSHDLEGSGTRVELGYRYQFGQSGSVYARARQAPDVHALGVGGSLRTRWRDNPVMAAAEVERSNQGTRAQARADLRTEHGMAGVRVSSTSGRTQVSAHFNGAVHIGGGDITLLNHAGTSHAVIDVPGQANVPVKLGGRAVGRTNEDGRLVVSAVAPLMPQAVELDVRGLPLGVEVGETKKTVRAQRLGGMHLVFPVETEQARVFTVVGEGLEPGLVVRSSTETTALGYEGLLFLEHPEPSQSLEVEGVCRLTLPDTLPAYGDAVEVRCLPLGK